MSPGTYFTRVGCLLGALNTSLEFTHYKRIITTIPLANDKSSYSDRLMLCSCDRCDSSDRCDSIVTDMTVVTNGTVVTDVTLTHSHSSDNGTVVTDATQLQ